jgi:hypothetical protein
MQDTFYRVNTDSIVHEIVDGEAIIINLQTGTFYNTSGVGLDIWRLIGAGASMGQLVDAIAEAYQQDRVTAEAAIRGLTDQLLAEDILLCEAAATVVAAPRARLTAPAATTFEPPRLDKHENLSDLLLLDPIHEVDEQGWPHRKPAETCPTQV